MTSSRRRYIHGTEPEEQRRLSTLNDILNDASLRLVDIAPGDRILDVGSGLGQFSRAMAREAGAEGCVVGIEASGEQLAEAVRLAQSDPGARAVEFRRGDAAALPLSENEWGTFDVAHARFLLEHVGDPQAVVDGMVRALRPGGRVVLEDDDHDVLRLWPSPPEFEKLWAGYIRTYSAMGFDPYIGRRLVALLHHAGAVPSRNEWPFFGGVAGGRMFNELVDNFSGIVDGARDAMARESGLIDVEIDAGLAAFKEWGQRAGSALWYGTFWAEGRKPEGDGVSPTG